MTDTGYREDLVPVAANPGHRRWRAAALAKAVPAAVMVLALGFLSFVAGSFLTFTDSFPANHLTDAFRGGQALLAQRTQYATPFPSDFWQPARTQARGVTIYDPQRAQNGFTLYTSGHSQKAYLISMNGEVVHEWHLPYSAIWDESAAVGDPQPDERIYLRKAQLLPDGDLLALYVAIGTSPWGLGLVRLTKDSEIVWKYLEQTHHDFDVGPDGRIYALTHEIRTDVVPGHQHLATPRIDDYAVVLSPEGEELQKIWLLGALASSPYGFVLSTVPWYVGEGKGDYLHTNSIDVVTEEEAANAPFASPGQILLSLREVGTIALLDPASETMVWALRGPWLRQHDADLLPDGRLLLFDNEGAPDGRSRLLELDPATQEITWSYAGDERHPFYSRVRSALERLPNGNTLVTD
ncbi:MAG TPA: arylsulfotransferase family protein, partial [Kofleriaceae bacterium]|nr:arylsulfotransferase family protein [Kofleriaceae bacterium]